MFFLKYMCLSPGLISDGISNVFLKIYVLDFFPSALSTLNIFIDFPLSNKEYNFINIILVSRKIRKRKIYG